MRSGKYVNSGSDEVLHLDIPPRSISLDCVSATLMADDELISHWFAPISLNPASGKWHGDIIKTINCDFEKVTIWKTSETEVDVFLYMHGHAIKHRYIFEDHHFRKLTIKINYQSGISPLLDYDPTDHYEAETYHNSVQKEHLSLESVMKRSGVQLETVVVPEMLNTQLVKGGAWSDAELNYAMAQSWPDRPSDIWTLWVLFANELEGHPLTAGRMFDFEDKNQREGTVIFVNGDLKIEPCDDEETKQDKRRTLFWTLFHEVGHAFNLGHSHDREAHKMWIPFTNDMEERSYMNYPENTSDDFFKFFNHQFSYSGLRFLRHAPDEMVRMGGAPWFRHIVNGQISATRHSGLILKLRSDKQELEYMEPAMVEIRLENNSDHEIEVDKNCLRNSMNLSLSITYNEGEKVFYKNFVYDCFKPDKIRLGKRNNQTEKSTLKEPLFISAGKDGWIIQSPGKYKINATFFLGNEILVSNDLELVVNRGSEGMQMLADQYFTQEVGRIYAFDGAYSSESGNEILRTIVNDHEKSMAAIHAKIALAMPYARDFKMLDPQGVVTIQSANEDLARESLSWALEQEVSEQTLGKLDHIFYTKELNKLRNINSDNSQ